jgi:hypothetical protein
MSLWFLLQTKNPKYPNISKYANIPVRLGRQIDNFMVQAEAVRDRLIRSTFFLRKHPEIGVLRPVISKKVRFKRNFLSSPDYEQSVNILNYSKKSQLLRPFRELQV